MYARLTTIVFGETEDYDAASLFRHVLPTVEDLDGFKAMMVLSGMDERSFVVLTMWQTAHALNAAEPVLEGVKRAETSHRDVQRLETDRFYVSGSRFVA
jgi:heme-degrading monooxygenase HmoA